MPVALRQVLATEAAVEEVPGKKLDAAFTAMFSALTPSQRVRMMSEMFDTARRILVSGIRAEQPEITDTELKVEVFLRTYRDDYAPPSGTGSSRTSASSCGRPSRSDRCLRVARVLPQQRGFSVGARHENGPVPVEGIGPRVKAVLRSIWFACASFGPESR